MVLGWAWRGWVERSQWMKVLGSRCCRRPPAGARHSHRWEIVASPHGIGHGLHHLIGSGIEEVIKEIIAKTAMGL
jgi:hypothetical protein